MAFDTDVFISYAHLDNQPLKPEALGWVSEFHEALSNRLGEVLGKAPRIWRDPKLQGNDIFADEIGQRFKGTAVLVSITTPRYVESDWCQRELSGFWRAADAAGTAVVDNKSRVFKVLKTPVQRQRLPAPLEALLGYEFYRLQPENGRPLEFNRIYGPDAERDFWVRLNDLAYDLADLLARLEDGATVDDLPMVYLATASSDVQADRDAMRRELQRHGHRVLPDEELPLVAGALEAAVVGHLNRCAVSVHLVGRSYGVVPEGTTESVAALEVRLASARARAGQQVRLVWMPPGPGGDDLRHSQLVESLRDDPIPGAGSDLLEGSVDELKALALNRLDEARTARDAAPGEAPVDAARIYLVCDQRDLAAVEPLRDHLFALGFEATLPAFEGDETALREDHAAQMQDCDAVMIYYGAAGELWVRQKLADLRRLAALGRVAPLRAAQMLVAPPATLAKQRLLTRDVEIVTITSDDPAQALAPLLARLRDTTKAA